MAFRCSDRGSLGFSGFRILELKSLSPKAKIRSFSFCSLCGQYPLNFGKDPLQRMALWGFLGMWFGCCRVQSYTKGASIEGSKGVAVYG